MPAGKRSRLISSTTTISTTVIDVVDDKEVKTTDTEVFENPLDENETEDKG